MKNTKVYTEILEVLDKHAGVIAGDYQIDIRNYLRERIRLEEIEEEFGIPIPNKSSQPSNNIQLTYDNWPHRIILYGEYKEGYQPISCSEKGDQPYGERLYVIQFPSGPYIFGQEYPRETFEQFFNELKAFGPKYSDRMNRGLWFTSENAKEVFEAYDGIYKKWQGKVEEELKQRRVDELKAELRKLGG